MQSAGCYRCVYRRETPYNGLIARPQSTNDTLSRLDLRTDSEYNGKQKRQPGAVTACTLRPTARWAKSQWWTNSFIAWVSASLMHDGWKSYRSESWMPRSLAGSAGITNHLWVVGESIPVKVPLLRWTPPKRAGKPKLIQILMAPRHQWPQLSIGLQAG